MVTVGYVDYTVQSTMPVPRNPPILSVFATNVRRMICPGDTVRISSSEDYVPSTLGRVIDIVDPSAALQSNIRAHPDNHLHGSCAALILTQLIMCKTHENIA